MKLVARFAALSLFAASVLPGAPTISAPPTVPLATSGSPVTLTVSATGSGTLSYQWRHYGTPLTGATAASLTLPSPRRLDAGYYDVVVTDSTGSTTSAAVRLRVAPTAYPTHAVPDPAYQPIFENSGSYVRALAQTTEGKFIIAGHFSRVGVTAVTTLARLNADGTHDTAFQPPALNNDITVVALQSDGRILVGGNFTQVGAVQRPFFARFNADGTFDSSFALGAGPDASVTAIFPESDGRIVIAGNFSRIGTVSRNYLARLHADGSLDASYNPAPNSNLTAVARHSDGRLLVAGYFSAIGGLARARLARLLTDGSADPAFDPGTGPNSNVNALALQSDGAILIGGDFTTYAGATAARLARLTAAGVLDQSFNVGSGPDSSVRGLVLQSDGRVLVTGYFNSYNGTSRRSLIRLSSVGVLDTTFTDFTNFSSPDSVLPLSDGRLVLGLFGQVRKTTVDGVLDSGGFSTAMEGTMYPPFEIMVQSNGQALVAGYFSRVNGQTRRSLARLNSDGSLDPAYQPITSGNAYQVLPESGGRYYVRGDFSQIGGVSRARLARLLADGTTDLSFDIGVGPNNYFSSTDPLVLQPDGRLVWSGVFTTFSGAGVPGKIVRLNRDGSRDTTFAPSVAGGEVRTIGVQADGKLLLVGSFTSVNGTAANHVALLLPTGALDPSFLSTGVGFGALSAFNFGPPIVESLENGRWLVSWNFSSYNGLSRPGSMILNSDGSVDSTFNPGSTGIGRLYSAVRQENGRILGRSDTGGVNRMIETTGVADADFRRSSLSVNSSYENQRLVLDDFGRAYAAGSDWTYLRAKLPTATPRLIAPSTPAHDTFAGALALSASTGAFLADTTGATRATDDPTISGFAGTATIWYAWTPTASGIATFVFQNRSGSVRFGAYTGSTVAALTAVATSTGSSVQFPVTAGTTYRLLFDSTQTAFDGATAAFYSVGALPVIVTPPASQTATVGSSVTFTVAATSAGTLQYQWFRDGTALAGATAAALTLTNVQLAHVGTYTVTVINSIGSVTSAGATLSGTDPLPVIGTQPAAVAVTAGAAVNLTVSATGNGTLAYQWRRNGVALAGATAATYALPSASRTDADTYDVVVYRGLSATTSSPARLTVAPTAYAMDVTLDPAKPAVFESDSATINRVWPLADGRAYAAGRFVNVNGAARFGLVRLAADGSLDSSFASIGFASGDYLIYDLVVQPDGKLIIAGYFYSVAGQSRSNFTRLNADGTLDTTFATRGFNNDVYAVALQPDGKILVGGYFSSYYDQNNVSTSRAQLARLNADGTLDTAFNPGASGLPRAFAVQADGKILVGGEFSTIAGQTRSYLARLNADGTYDSAFAAAGTGPNSPVRTLCLQPDGKLLVGGWFSTFHGTSVGRIARLTTTGALDVSFVTGTGFSSDVNTLALQSDGQILVGGYFGSYAGSPRNSVARLSASGALDTTFAPTAISSVLSLSVAADGRVLASGNVSRTAIASQGVALLSAIGALDPNFAPAFRAQGYVNCSVLLPGGKVLVGGQFTHLNGTAVAGRNLARLNGDGTIDPTFNPGTGPSGTINTILLQPDGRLVMGGSFSSYNGTSKPNLVRVSADGALDSAFPSGAVVPNSSVMALAFSAGGKLLIGGQFTSLGSATRNRLARLNPDGSIDLTFDPGAGPNNGANSFSYVRAFATTPDGKVYVGGYFNTVVDQPRGYLARLNADGTLDPSFADPGFTSEVRTLALQPDGKLLAGGYFYGTVSGIARFNPDGTRDSAFVPPTNLSSVQTLVLQEDGRVLIGGYLGSVGGSPNTSYLARLNTDGSQDTRFSASSLGSYVNTITVRDDGSLFLGGGYALGGIVTVPAAPAAPSIYSYSGGRTVAVGATVTLSVTVYGVPIPTFQWKKGGVDISGATASSYTRTNVQLADAGTYTVVATNPSGSATSSGMILTVNPASGGPLNDNFSAAEILSGDSGSVVGTNFNATGESGEPTHYNAAGSATSIWYAWTPSISGTALVSTDGSTFNTVMAVYTGSVLTVLTKVGQDDDSGAGTQSLLKFSTTAGTTYRIAVGSYFAGTSGNVVLNYAVAATPTITTQPANQIGVLGGSASFTVATSAAGVNYQWYHDGLAISGATAASLTLTNLQPAAGGTYHVVLSNIAGDTSSNVVTLAGTDPVPVIGTQPAAVAATAGAAVNLTVSATGNGTLAYQWRRNGVALAGATAATYALPSVSRTDADTYDVVVYRGLSATTSSSARLTVAPTVYATDVTLDPTKPAVFENDSATINRVWPLADGRAYAAGRFVNANGVARFGLVRLAADGSLDSSFASTGFTSGDYSIYDLVVQPDGKLIIAGYFYSVAGQSRSNFTRLNADGTLDTTFATRGFSSDVYTVALQPDGKILVGGFFNSYYDQNNVSTSRAQLARLNADGTLDVAFNPGASGLPRAFAVQADGKILVGGEFSTIAGQTRSYLARLNPDGTYDSDFAAAGSGPNSYVRTLLLQPDGKLLVGGWFSTIHGTTAGRIARLTTTGALDATFVTGTGFNSDVNALVLQSDGQILVGGYFGSYAGTSRSSIARLSTLGALDSTFTPTAISSIVSLGVAADGRVLAGGNVSRTATASPGVARLSATGVLDPAFAPVFRALGYVNSSVLLPGGKVLVGGQFTHLNGTALAGRNLARFNTDGTLDLAFNPGTGPSGTVNTMLLQPDGRIVLGGSFSSYNSTSKPNLARILADGALDAAYPSGAAAPNSSVMALAFSAGGKLLIGGQFTSVGSVTRNRLARLNPDGALDLAFDPGTGPDYSGYSYVRALAAAPDGKVYVGGYFNTFAGQPRGSLARLNADGTLDPAFADPGLTSDVLTLALQPDGKLLAGGYFSGVARFNPDGTRDTAFVTLTNLGFVRSLVLQEDGRVLVGGSFSYFGGTRNTAYLTRLNTDGTQDTHFSAVGLGSSVSTITVRDDGRLFLGGGYGLGGVITVPAALAAPSVYSYSGSRTVAVGATVTLSVTASGVPIPSFQWKKGGVDIAGATASSYTLANVQLADAGTYTVVATNSSGSVTSSAMILTVNSVIPEGLANGSVRTLAGGAAPAQLIGAFTIEGTTSKQMLLRAVGPALSAFGVAGVLIDPRLEIVNAGTGATVGANDDWSSAANASQVTSVTSQVGAIALTSGSKDAAVLATFAPGTYRVFVTGAAASAGVVLLEIYDADANPRLVYLATRAPVGPGEQVLIQGLVVTTPPAGRSYLMRALGPTLGFPGALADPQLSVYSGSNQVAFADDWTGDGTLANLALAAGAMPLPATSKDAVLSFAPTAAGPYTVQVTGVAATTGVALLEIFEVDAQRSASMAPAIVSGPEKLAVVAGSPATFGVVAIGKPAPTFQWRKGGAAIAGATLSKFTLAAAQTADTGTYDVVITNVAYGSVTSGAAILTVSDPTTPSATHAVVGAGYVAGSTVTITNTLTYVGTAASLGWSVTLPDGWTYVASAGSAGDTRPAVGATGTLGWAWTSVPASPVTFTYTVAVPAGETVTRSLTAGAIVRPVGTTVVNLVANPSPLPVPRVSAHRGDTNQDFHFNLVELTRVIELYNTRFGSVRTGRYSVAASTTEDGFNPDMSLSDSAVVTLSSYHSADTNRDGKIGLFELTRVIELYNTRSGTVRTGAYRPAAGTEDGYEPIL